MWTKHPFLMISLFGLGIGLLGPVIGLSVVLSRPPDGAISLPKCSTSSISPSDPSVTLMASLPQPMATFLVGHHLLVLVPKGVGYLHIANDNVLRSECSVVLANHSTEVVVTALASGQSNIGAEPTVRLQAEIPAFGAHVIVRRVPRSR